MQQHGLKICFNKGNMVPVDQDSELGSHRRPKLRTKQNKGDDHQQKLVNWQTNFPLCQYPQGCWLATYKLSPQMRRQNGALKWRPGRRDSLSFTLGSLTSRYFPIFCFHLLDVFILFLYIWHLASVLFSYDKSEHNYCCFFMFLPLCCVSLSHCVCVQYVGTMQVVNSTIMLVCSPSVISLNLLGIQNGTELYAAFMFRPLSPLLSCWGIIQACIFDVEIVVVLCFGFSGFSRGFKNVGLPDVTNFFSSNEPSPLTWNPNQPPPLMSMSISHPPHPLC